METQDIPTAGLSNWQPITDKYTLAVLGKLAEEAGELGSAISRCIIQGLDESEPKTKKVNREWLEEEIADTFAMAINAIMRLDLDNNAIDARLARKIVYKNPWFDSLEKKDGGDAP